MVNGNGLDIGLGEFKRMKSLDRDTLIYHNIISIRAKMGDYRFHKKIQYTWLSILTAIVVAILGLRKIIGG